MRTKMLSLEETGLNTWMSISWERLGQVIFVGSLSFVAIESGRKGIFRERSTLESKFVQVAFSWPIKAFLSY